MKHAEGTIKKVHVLRIEPGEDVLLSIQQYCDEHHILSGVILSGIGSLDGCTFFDPQEMPGKPGLYGYVTPISRPTPIELVGLNGIVCGEADGKAAPHIHACFADDEGNEYGGHLKEGNRVLVTVELAIAELSGIRMSRKLDPVKAVPVLFPEADQ
ncbi:PPC domain-containing DNA-binding protein [Oscillibacter sp. GMB15532]|uniref:PPC domain-containing DNA-binding protein n=1 Tax=Oscillibacter sp. GMB15532 TaxID=3230022 RepID=UPI0034DE0B6C